MTTKILISFVLTLLGCEPSIKDNPAVAVQVSITCKKAKYSTGGIGRFCREAAHKISFCYEQYGHAAIIIPCEFYERLDDESKNP